MFLHYIRTFIKTEGVKDKGKRQIKTSIEQHGVDNSLDLSVDRHVSRVCAGCFYRPRQLRRIRFFAGRIVEC